jgi:ketosteroid isomerase-like protein
MIKTLKASLLLYVSINTAMATNQEEQNMSHEQSTIISTIQTMTTAFHNSDIAGVLASYEKNAAVMFEPAKQVNDQAEVKKVFEELFQLNPKFDYSGHEVYIANDLALHIAPWTMRGNAPDGSVIEQSGLSVAVLRKQIDGNWLMVLDNPHGQRLNK